jgi:putative DNA primase/helicase
MTNASPAFLSAADLMAGDVAPREFILEPLLAGNGIGLLYGPAGIGKSFVALGIAWAAASGGSFLGWRAPRPRRVLYIDGEMGEVDMRERLALFGPEPPGLDFWLAGRDDGPSLQLDTLEGQLRLMESWDWPDLVVLDGTAGLTGRTTGDAGYSRGLQHFLLW